jgi:hypothetical protein
LDTDLKSLIDFYARVVAGRAGPELGMACAESLERGLLDYSLESLHAIDRYLQGVHVAQEGILTIAYANTIVGTAIYVGEVIRRGSPSTEYRWGRSAATAMNDSSSGVELSDLSDVILLSHSTGGAIVPADAVLRIIRRGAQAPTIHSFAVSAIRSAWTAIPT